MNGYNRNQTINNQPMEQQESTQRLRNELQSHAYDIPKPHIKDERKTSINGDQDTVKYVTILVRSQGTNTKAVQIKKTASLDELIAQINSSAGLGRNPGNTYLACNGKELSSGTGKTVEQAGLQDRSTVDVCVRTLGG